MMTREVDLTEGLLFNDRSKRYDPENPDNNISNVWKYMGYEEAPKSRIPWRTDKEEQLRVWKKFVNSFNIFDSLNSRYWMNNTSSYMSNYIIPNDFDNSIFWHASGLSSEQTLNFIKYKSSSTIDYVMNLDYSNRDELGKVEDSIQIKTSYNHSSILILGKVEDIRKYKNSQIYATRIKACKEGEPKYCKYCRCKINNKIPWKESCDKCIENKNNKRKFPMLFKKFKREIEKRNLSAWSNFNLNENIYGFTFKHFYEFNDVYDDKYDAIRTKEILMDLVNGIGGFRPSDFPYVYYKGIDKTRPGFMHLQSRRHWWQVSLNSDTEESFDNKDWKDLVRENNISDQGAL